MLVLLELAALAICVVMWPFIDHFELDSEAPQHPWAFWDYAPAIDVLGAVVVVVGVVAVKGRATITAVSQLVIALLVAAVLAVGSVAQLHDDKRQPAPAPGGRALAASTEPAHEPTTANEIEA
ncbi:DUF6234 family protein [Streptomyces xanthochromogenes]|uniref:DUF6234 family protein n=1 Tax=Streptomyces xanthochromogenes TaxID=67384 RepID=UPI003F4CFF82